MECDLQVTCNLVLQGVFGEWRDSCLLCGTHTMEYRKYVPCKPMKDVSEQVWDPLLSFMHEMSLCIDPKKSFYWERPNVLRVRTRGYVLLFYSHHKDEGYQIDTIATPLGEFGLPRISGGHKELRVEHTRVLEWVKEHCTYRDVTDELTIGVMHYSKDGKVKEAMVHPYSSEKYWIHYPEKRCKDYYQEIGKCILIESFRGEPLYDTEDNHSMVVYDGVHGYTPYVDFLDFVSEYPDYLPWGRRGTKAQEREEIARLLNTP